jgi:hypothetical protein
MSEALQQDVSEEEVQDEHSDDQQLPSKVQIDGEEIDLQQAINDHKNKKEWQKSQTQRDQEIASQRKEVNDLLSKVIDRVAPDNNEAKTAVSNSFDIDGMIEKIPDPIEDEKGYKAGIADLLKNYGESLKNEISQQTESLKSETQNQIASQSQKDRIVQDNLRMVRDYVANNIGDVSETEVNEVIKRVGQKWGPEYGAEDSSGAFRYNDTAVEEAIWGVPSLRTRLMASETNEARKEGLTGRQRGQQGQPPTNRAVPQRPGSNAPIGDKINWLQSLSSDEMQRAVSRMDSNERNSMLQALYGG